MKLMAETTRMIYKDDIKNSLSLLEIRKGDIVLVHSALTSIGYVDGGADTVIDALLETVGDEGTIVMSSLTNWDKAFDAKTSPSAVGKISETFRKRENAVRSLHPVHSVAAIGKSAEYIAAGHDTCETGCGMGTPYMKIHDLGGKIMLLGVDMDRNTFMHTIEVEADAKYLKQIEIPAPTYIENWRNKTITLSKFPPGHRDFISFTSQLRKKNAILEGMIGNAAVKIMDARKAYKIGIALLEQDPLSFICHNTNCNFCDAVRTKSKGADMSEYLCNGCCNTNCEICVVTAQ